MVAATKLPKPACRPTSCCPSCSLQPLAPVALSPGPRCPGEEAEEEDAEAAEAAARLKIRSAHDALEDERLAKEPAVDIDLDRRAAAVSFA